uniref:Uncharacterized protein n=1 Tax=Anguilla anguilla TaxID=7936 RepID=A0A0E9TEN6_ANGAN
MYSMHYFDPTHFSVKQMSNCLVEITTICTRVVLHLSHKALSGRTD